MEIHCLRDARIHVSPLMAGTHMLPRPSLCCSASHGVADGSSIASFLLNWAMVSCGGTRLPLAPFDRALISAPAASGEAVDGEGKEGEAQTEELSMSQDFVEVGGWDRDTRQYRGVQTDTYKHSCGFTLFWMWFG